MTAMRSVRFSAPGDPPAWLRRWFLALGGGVVIALLLAGLVLSAAFVPIRQLQYFGPSGNAVTVPLQATVAGDVLRRHEPITHAGLPEALAGLGIVASLTAISSVVLRDARAHSSGRPDDVGSAPGRAGGGRLLPQAVQGVGDEEHAARSEEQAQSNDLRARDEEGDQAEGEQHDGRHRHGDEGR
jgi:hypothetical protein